ILSLYQNNRTIVRKGEMMKTRITISIIFALTILWLTTLASGNSSTTLLQPPNPKDDATANITFRGLMALTFVNPERVSIGILDVIHHKPELKISQIKDGKEKVLLHLEGEDLRDSLYMDVDGEKSPVSRYQADASDPNNFKWTIDFETDLHQRKLH